MEFIVKCSCDGSCVLCDDAGMLHLSAEDMADRAARDAVDLWCSPESPMEDMDVATAADAAWEVESETTFLDVPDGTELDHARAIFLDTFARLAA